MEKFRILSLDGGGIRGIITAVILKEIEQKTGQKLQNYFHLIAGTSTGSILAAGIALGYTADQLLGIYKDQGKDIFPDKGLGDILNRWNRIFEAGLDVPQYKNDGLKKVLQEKFTEEKVLKDLAPKLILITSYDAFNRKPLLICNWLKEWAYLPIWEACISSASAPTFFPSFKLNMDDPSNPGNDVEINAIDGGVFANNPTTCAIAQALKLCDNHNDLSIVETTDFSVLPNNRNELLESLSVLSVGTGKYTRRIEYEQSKDWGTLQWVAPLIDVMFDGSNGINNQIVSCLIKKQNAYLRLQPKLDEGSDDIDDASHENIEKLINLADDYVKSPKIQVDIDKFLETSS
jgi:patatin-like phospholipase/acyl hydrolase